MQELEDEFKMTPKTFWGKVKQLFLSHYLVSNLSSSSISIFL